VPLVRIVLERDGFQPFCK